MTLHLNQSEYSWLWDSAAAPKTTDCRAALAWLSSYWLAHYPSRLSLNSSFFMYPLTYWHSAKSPLYHSYSATSNTWSNPGTDCHPRRCFHSYWYPWRKSVYSIWFVTYREAAGTRYTRFCGSHSVLDGYLVTAGWRVGSFQTHSDFGKQFIFIKACQVAWVYWNHPLNQFSFLSFVFSRHLYQK